MFNLDKSQSDTLSMWWDKHPCSKKSGGAIGGSLIYKFIPTNLGVVTKVQCGHANCNEEIDLTDYYEW